jgi:hypothetical protein
VSSPAADVSVPAAGAPSPAPGVSVPATDTPSLSAGTPARPVTYRVGGGATLDLGWTGIAHGQAWPLEQRLRFGIACRAGSTTCALGGGSAGAAFGAPMPLSAGGISVCVVSTLRAPVTGTSDPRSGCGTIELKLASAVFTGATLARPCPRCADDPTPNDGRKEGHCDGGARRDAPCDGESASAVFGTTSSDCPPPAASGIGELAIDLSPLTTGHARRAAATDCVRKVGFRARCFCREQTQPNDCADGTCGPDGRCEHGPVDGACSRAPYRACIPGAAPDECTTDGPCEERRRPCFGEAVEAHGACDPRRPTYVALFCAPPTRAPAVNTTAGLPGPARIVLPLEVAD